MATFTSIQRAAAFSPIGAFPLDSRYYFTSLADAKAAASQAAEVGSTDTVYYYGQLLTVVEGTSAKLYIIQPNNNLLEVGSKSGLIWNDFDSTEPGSTPSLGTTWINY